LPQEVAAHNSPQSAWVYHGNKVYDVTQWVDRHPGGREMLLLVAGRDVTDVLPSYHPFSDRPEKVLAGMEIGELVTREFPPHKPDSGFYRELRDRVGDYFKKSGKDPKDPLPGLIRLAGIMTVAFFSLKIAHDAAYNWLVRILAAQLFGVCQALPLLHTMVRT
jgi:hypothetical protein